MLSLFSALQPRLLYAVSLSLPPLFRFILSADRIVFSCRGVSSAPSLTRLVVKNHLESPSCIKALSFIFV